MSHKYFHFTLGPVQGFVAQARRTRDFWAGSFLLSWLSAVAMQATLKQKGSKILFPEADQNYLDFVEGIQTAEPPQQGGVPNRFKAEIPENFKPEIVIESVQEAWEALAKFVWEKDIRAILQDDDILAEPWKIWQNQIQNFWDMTWVISSDNTDSSALDRRKNWRTWFLPDQPGVKCTVMGTLQEISGVERPNRDDLDNFWGMLREKKHKGIESDFSENEAVCAITYVKRRFSRYFEDFPEHQMEQGWQLKGWKVPSGVPSVSYMAAVHWLEKTLDYATESQLENFRASAKKLTGSYGEWQTKIACLKDKGNKLFTSLDGNVFYPNNLENPNLYPDKEEEKKKLLGLLQDINNIEELEPATPFYAVLMMDGDSLGIHMSDEEKQPIITKGLKDFTNQVKTIVESKSGFLIYAGGDDVLAIMPLEDAIPCAVELRQTYMDCFAGELDTTISAAIEYAHIKTPLTKILKDAHDLLDKVAKDQTGRDAIAIRVWKPGGKQLEWAQPWEIALFTEQQTYLEQLTENFINKNEQDNQFSNKFLYKIKERFDLINLSETFNEDVALDLMAVEYIQSGKTDISKIKDGNERMDRAKDEIRPLIKQCRPTIRDPEKEAKDWEKKSLQPDAALLIRFLAQKGVEK